MSVFIVAEAGSNFRAGPPDDAVDFARAVRLIHVAADAGADACKFQFWTSAARIYAPGAGAAAYLAGRGDDRPIDRVFDDLRLPALWLPRLAATCAERKIEFMASVFHPDDVPIVDPWVRRHKIASYEMGYEALVRACAATGKPLILSTGAHTDSEVRQAAAWAISAGCTNLTLMHCTACYPAPPESLNLRAIGVVNLGDPAWASGYSDHSAEWWTPIVAVTLGATTIEKHFTLRRDLPGPDHAFALEPDELRQMVQAIRHTEAMLGDGQKRVMLAEKPLRRFAVRQVVATRAVAVGDRLRVGYNIDALRPGDRAEGEWAGRLSMIDGSVAARSFVVGDGVRLTDIETP